MSNEASYAYSMPGGKRAFAVRPYLDRYANPDVAPKDLRDFVTLNDFVTLGEAGGAMGALKAAAPTLGAAALGWLLGGTKGALWGGGAALALKFFGIDPFSAGAPAQTASAPQGTEV